MKKFFTIASILLLATILLVVACAFYLIHFVDPNKFKGRISQYVFAKTGQVLVIHGNMEWSVFPWVGLKAKNLIYYNAPHFTPKTFVSAKEMDIKIKLIPLLTGKIQVGTITLNEATLNLIKNKIGEFNWQTITKQDSPGQKLKGNKRNLSPNSRINFSIESLKIKNGRLNWLNQENNSKQTVTALNVNSRHMQLGQSFPLSLQFNLISNNERYLAVNLATEVTLPTNYHQVNMSNINLRGEYLGNHNKLKFRINGNLSADIFQQTVLSNLYFVVNNIGGRLDLNSHNLLFKHIPLHALVQSKLKNENKKIAKELAIYQVPIKISGKLSNPHINVDFAELAKIFHAKEID